MFAPGLVLFEACQIAVITGAHQEKKRKQKGYLEFYFEFSRFKTVSLYHSSGLYEQGMLKIRSRWFGDTALEKSLIHSASI